jgi:hypothetical protein
VTTAAGSAAIAGRSGSTTGAASAAAGSGTYATGSATAGSASVNAAGSGGNSAPVASAAGTGGSEIPDPFDPDANGNANAGASTDPMCKDVACFDVFDCWLGILGGGGLDCNFTECDAFVCK